MNSFRSTGERAVAANQNYKERDYWLTKLSGELNKSTFPYDGKAGTAVESGKKTVNIKFPEELSARLLALSNESDSRLYMILVTGLVLLLYKYSGSSDIMIGSPVLKQEIEDSFINTVLVLRNQIDDNMSFKELLLQVKDTIIEATDNQNYPLETLLYQLDMEPTGDDFPLFDIALLLENIHDKRYIEHIKFNILFSFLNVGDLLEGTIEYNPALFRETSMERVAVHLIQLLREAVFNLDMPVSGINMVSEREKKQLLFEFQNAKAFTVRDKCYHRLFEESVPGHPTAVAAVYNNHHITYKELNEIADRIAFYLIEKGAKTGDVIGLYMTRSIEMLASIIGIFKANCAYLPIDVEYPENRVQYVLEKGDAAVLITEGKLAEAVNRFRESLPLLEHVFYFPAPNFPWEGTESMRSTDRSRLPGTGNTPDDLAYVIFTSGTTGEPKGVMIHHLGMINHLHAKINDLAINREDIVAQTASASFDISVWQFLAGLLKGGCTWIIDKEVVLNPGKFLKTLQKGRITILESVPSLMTVFLEMVEHEKNNELKYLRWMVPTGEALGVPLVRKWYRCYPGIKLLNAYGPTEASDDVTHYVVEDIPDAAQTSIPIGKPLQNLHVYILDKNLGLCPIGVRGEISVAGIGVGKGYWKDSEKTIRAFVPNPFYREIGDPDYKTIYKTGDMGYFRSDGNVECLGRWDDQVKIRGNRIELGEIEKRLLGHHEIKEAAVIVKEGGNDFKYLCAFVVNDHEMDKAGIKEYLSGYLPEYMIPSYIVPLDRLPLTPNGKIDRKKLQGYEVAEEAEHIAPRNEIEEILVDIYRSVLGRDNVGINENFFTIGGDSIRSIQIVSRLNKAGYTAEMRDLFQYPVISDLALQIKKLEHTSEQAVITGEISLTPTQEEFFSKYETAPHHFNQSVLLFSKEGFDEETVKAVFMELQKHHDALRMTFKKENGRIVQVNNGLDYPLSLQVFDFVNRKNAPKELEKMADRIQAGIDLANGPLMKLGLFHLDDGDRLLIVIHHLVIDGISWRILLEDIESLLDQYKRDEKPVLPSKTDSYKLWSEKLSEYADSKTFLREMTYWKELESHTVHRIPKDFEVDDDYVKDSRNVSITFGEEETGLLLTRVNEVYNTEINDILLTALVLGINKTFGHSPVLIELEAHGRGDILENMNISRTVGWFSSVYPVLMDLSYANDTGRQLKEIKETLRRIPNKGIGYGILEYLTREEYKKEMDFKLKPQVGFNYLGQFDAEVKQISTYEIAKESSGNEVALENPREYELNVSGMIAGGRLTMMFSYNKRHFKPGTMTALADNYESELRRIIRHCGSKKNVERTPGDFTYKGLTIESVDRFMALYPDVEDIYTLTPMQEGMLFYALYDQNQEKSTAYFEQFSYRLQGELDILFVEKSINELFKRYDVLRTVFIHEGLSRPLQVVLKERKVEFYFEDLGEVLSEPGEREKFIRDFKERDKRRGFDLSKDVLMRISVIRLDETEYEFTWSHHHILMDGWCIGILIAEYLEIYESYLENRRYRLPIVKPYRNYIRWLQELETGTSMDYWSAYLANYEELSGIPRVNSFKGYDGEYKLGLFGWSPGVELSGGLNRLAIKNKVTLNVLLQTMWAILLGRYNNKEDVVFGVVVSGRPSQIEGIESMIGLFINTIPVRIRFEEEMTFNSLARDTQQKALESESHHHCSLAEIQSESNLKQNLLDHIWVFENYPIGEQIDGAINRGMGDDNKSRFELSGADLFAQTNYDFNVVIDGGDDIRITFKYNKNQFEENSIEKISNHFKRIIEHVVDNNDVFVNELSLLTDDEREEILYRFNDTAAEYPKSKTIRLLFEEQVEKTPDKIAVVGPNGVVSYRELNNRSGHIAELLKAKDITPGTIVGIMVEPSLEMMVGMVGVLRTGGAFLPIEAESPVERVNYLLDDSRMSILLAQSHLSEPFKTKVEVINIDDGNIYRGESRDFKHAAGPGDPIYAIYTSGTTGRPKGVLIANENMVNYVYWFVRTVRLTASDKAVLTSSFAFDALYTQVFSSLLTGCELHVIPRETFLFAERLLNYLQGNKITYLKATPSLFYLIVNSSRFTPGVLRELKFVMLGGEELNVNDVEKAHMHCPHLRFMNHYGPTETTIGSIARFIDFDKFSEYKLAPTIGRPIGNTGAYILDKSFHPVPIGVVGELFIEGDGVGIGYVNNPEFTSEKFITGLFGRNYSVYATGDLARWRPDGDIEFLGRADHQVQIRGYRVEPGEIESHLLRYDDLSEAVVMVRGNRDREKYLCGYFVSGKEIDISELRDFLSERLPQYMIPSYFIQLEKMPLTKHNKLNRWALPEPSVDVSPGCEAPEGEIEEKLVEAWADILGVERAVIERNANFFQLGGHSLKAIVLISRIHKLFDVEIPLAELFKIPTVKELAVYIKDAESKMFASIEAVEEKEFYPPSSAQRRMYVLQQMEVGSSVYNIPRILFLEEKPDRERLEHAFTRLIRRHESLRTSFEMVDKKPVQRIHREVSFNLEYYESPGSEAVGSTADFIRPFNLKQAPLVRGGLIVTGQERYILVTDMHHIISDGVSMDILVREFNALYRGEELTPLRLQYRDYSEWQNRWKEREEPGRDEAYWLKEFKGEVPVLNLPADYPRPLVQSFDGGSVSFVLEAEETGALKKMASEEGVTLYMLLLALYDVFLAKLTNQDDIVVGTPIAGRRHADLEKIIGMFVNTLALRSFPLGSRTFREFLKEVKGKALDAFENQEYPFEDLVESVEVNRDVSRNPLFDVMFSFQSRPPGNESHRLEDDGPREFSPFDTDDIFMISKFDLSLDALETEHRLHFSFEYCTKLFKKETIERFINYFKEVVSVVVKDPGIKIWEIEVLTGEERQTLLYEFNDTETSYGPDKTIHRLFEEQVERTPDNIAVMGPLPDRVSITYDELNDRADQWAFGLQENGVRYDGIVGIMMERSLEMIVRVLGILKSGGAYLPIDPGYPQERIDFLLKDSGAKILVTDNEPSPGIEVPGPSAVRRQSSVSPAYVIYTSGSTGVPKGVVVEHGSVVNLLFSLQQTYPFMPGDTYLLKTSYLFDVSVTELFGWYMGGGRLSILEPGGEKDPRVISDVIERDGVSHINFVPTMFNAFIDAVNPGNRSRLSGLKYIFLAGEALLPELVEKYRELDTGILLENIYGPTEGTVYSSGYSLSSWSGKGNIPIGKPLHNVKLYILGESNNLQPIGVPGELCISGVGLSRGYLNRPQLTAEKFNRSYRSYKSYKTHTLYRTGDLARWLADGNIEYLGRIDHQVKIRGFRVELGEIESRLLKHEEIKETVVTIRRAASGDKYLCAYIIPRPGIDPVGSDIRVLQEFLSRQLPDYMVPSHFVSLEEIPLTPTGKIDRKALPAPEGISLRENIDYIPPTGVLEKKLVEIWERVLGRNHIGVNENFFLIGGDSIKALQIMSRMSSAGYKLEMRDIFKYPNISGLAPRVKKLKRIPDQSIVTGAIPLTPIQGMFFNEPHIEFSHYNQAVMLHSPEGFDKEAVKKVFSRIQEHHDALRMTYKINPEDGHVVQVNHGLEYPLSIWEYDLKGRENNKEELQTRIDEIQGSIHLEEGPLVKLGLFHLEDGDRLLIVIHHLVIDGVSWRILFEDIETLFGQYKRGEKPVLPPKTDSFKLWSERISGYADSETFLKEKSYWEQLESNIVPGIPKDFQAEANDVKDTRSVSAVLEEEETELLLTRVNRAFNTEINDILLTALGLGIHKTFELDKVLVALEGHGREEVLDDMDINRTVGWFTTVYPVLMDISHVGDPGRQIKEIKETLRRIPNKGIGYGILKYLTSDENKKETAFGLKPQIVFNYLGQFDSDVNQRSFFEIAGESVGNVQAPHNRRQYELDVSGFIANDRLTMTFSYNETHFKPGTMAVLADNFKSELCRMIAFCSAKEKKEFTPGDFTYKGLSIETIDRLTASYPSLEDLYTLTPMQEGMLFHAWIDDSSYSYFEQMSYRLEGELDIGLVEQSLNELFRRHDILRTAFVYRDIEHPIQVVLKDRRAEFYYEDISKTLEREAREHFLGEFKEKDRARGFDLSNGTLMRVSILEVDKSEYELTWSFHHILMDGWCVGILNSEFFEIYSGYLEKRPYRLPALQPYRTYIRWLEKQDKEVSARYWQNYLDSFEEQTGVPKTTVIKKRSDEPEYRNKTVFYELNREKTAGLNKLAAGNHVTVNTVLQSLWGILLGKYNGKDDVVFGTVVSGRPFELEGVESMVGLFINSVPVRIRYEEKMEFHRLLQKVQAEAIAAEPHHYHPLAEIQSGSTLKQGLIDHLFAFENYPVTEQIEGYGRKRNRSGKFALKLRNVEVFEQSNYDFNVAVSGSDRLNIKFQYNGNAYNEDDVKRVANHFSLAVDQVLENGEVEIGMLTLLSGEEKKRVLYEFNAEEAEYPQDKTIHELFETRVERAPDNIAVIGPSVRAEYLENLESPVVSPSFAHVSYGKLNGESNRLARLLREKGVVSDTIVAVMADRSINMIAAILGILKAGGAYLPINPRLPEKRILLVLKEAGISLLVTRNRVVKKYLFTRLQDLQSGNRTVYLTAKRPNIRDLDSLPMPDRSLVDYQKYNRYIGQSLVKNNIAMLGSRGCPYNCAYCHNIWPKTHVTHSAEYMFKEVEFHYNMGVKRFTFLDDVFNLNQKNSRRFLELVIEKNLDIQLFLCLRGDILTKEYIDLMVKAGTVRVAVALETASPRLQEMIGKRLNLRAFRENLEYLCEKYPNVILELNTMHGFPTETEEEAMMTLEFIKSLKWIHFPYVHILKIYPNTAMERLALQNGVSRQAISDSVDLAYHELSNTIPFDRAFTLKYQADFFNQYFMSRERLLHVLPYQMEVLTEDEIIQKYNSYLPTEIKTFDDLLKLADIAGEELRVRRCMPEEHVAVPHMNKELSRCMPAVPPSENALKVLLLDLSQFFTHEINNMLYDVVEPPLGLIYLMTVLKKQYGENVNGKIAKSRIDFDNYKELRELIENFKPDLIGIRTLTFYRQFFHRTIANLRNWGVDAPIIAGGPYGTSDYKAILQDINVDIVAVGEGEFTFSEMVGKIIENKGKLPNKGILKGIPGLAFVDDEIEKTNYRKSSPREIVFLDAVEETLAGREWERSNPHHGNQPHDLAYVLFTSGSTGVPKGVAIEHRNVNNLVHGLNERIYRRFHENLNLGLVSPYEFDASVKLIFPALILGHRLHIVPEETRLDGSALFEFYKRYNIDISDGTPTHMQLLSEGLYGDHTDLDVTHFLIGGEVLHKKLAERFFNRFSRPGLEITNVYGPTECCDVSSSFNFSRETLGRYHSIPIGRPLPNMKIYILDTRGELGPVGAAGELCVAGVGVGRGYLNSQEFTAEKFMANSRVNQKKVYRTGDIARWLPDGNIEYLSRIDSQIKIRGFRIELGEIESALLSFNVIREAVVLAGEDAGGDKYLCAYIVSPHTIPASELKEYLSGYLPGHMLPSYFIRLETMPLTPNGKIDRKALPKPETGESDTRYTAPKEPTEEKLAEIWAEVLGIEKNSIGIDANFFELGGHSLKATIMAARVHKAFDVKLPLVEVFKSNTVRLLSEHIKKLGKDKYLDIEPVEKREYYEVSSGQKRVWVLSQSREGSISYNISATYHFNKKLDAAALKGAFDSLIEYHESLRTVFQMVDEEVKQKVLSPGAIRFFVDGKDIRDVEDKEKVVSGFLESERDTPFDLVRGPLLRAKLIQIETSEYLLLFTMHHIISDFLSMERLKEDFLILYESFKMGEKNPLRPLRIHYKDFAYWQNKQLEDHNRERLREYWCNQFNDEIPVLELPYDKERPDVQNYNAESIGFSIPEDVTCKLRMLANKNDATLFMVLFASINALLFFYSGQTDIIMGIPVSGRQHPDLENQIGFYLNTLPLRIKFREEETFTDVLGAVKKTALGAFEHQMYPFDKLIDDLKIKREPGRHPLLDVMVDMLNLTQWINPSDDLSSEPVESNEDEESIRIQKSRRSFDLTIYFYEGVNMINITFEYNTDLFEQETILRMVKRFRKLLERIVENPVLSISELTMPEEVKLPVFGPLAGR